MAIYQPIARKRFGQNFLQDEQVLQQIVRSINPQPNEHLVEIGPGLGALTKNLLSSKAKLSAVELDRNLIPHLLLQFGLFSNFKLYEGDALTFDFAKLASNQQKLRLVGNLPYNIATPLIFKLLTQLDAIFDMHFMLQKEVVSRLAANSGSRDFGRLSIMVQYFCEAQHLFDVDPAAFKPSPKVQSAIVRLVPHKIKPFIADDLTQFTHLVQKAFSQK